MTDVEANIFKKGGGGKNYPVDSLCVLDKNDENMVDTFMHKSLMRTLKIYWPQRVTNEEVS